MNFLNQLSPAAVLGISCVLIIFAGVSYRNAGYRRTLLLILAIGIILRIFTAADDFLHLWDESFHAVVAKNCMTTPLKPMLYAHPALPYDYKNWLANHIWLHKPPLSLWIMAGSLHLFGLNVFALRIPSIIFSSLLIYLAYSLGSRLWSRRHGLLAAFLCSINCHLINLAAGREATDHIDTLLITLISMAAFIILKSSSSKNKFPYDALLGAFIGLAYLTKGFPGLFPLCLWPVFAISDCRRSTHFRRLLSLRLSTILFVAAVTALPWIIYAHINYPKEMAWESNYSLSHLTDVLEGHNHQWHYYIVLINNTFGPILYFAWGWAVYNLFRIRPLDKYRLFVLKWFSVPCAIFSFSATKMPAYVSIGSLAGFLLISIFVFDMIKIILRLCKLHLWKRNVLILLLLLFLFVPLTKTMKCLHIVGDYDRSPSWALQLRQLAEKYPGSSAVVFQAPRAIAAMFYGDFTAYHFLPGQEEVLRIIAQGREVIVIDHGRLPGWVYGMENLHIHKPAEF